MRSSLFFLVACYMLVRRQAVRNSPSAPSSTVKQSQWNLGNRFPDVSPFSCILCFTSPAPVCFLTSSLPAPLVNSSFFRSDTIVCTLLSHVLVANSYTAPDLPVPWNLSFLSSIHFISNAQAALLPPMFYISPPCFWSRPLLANHFNFPVLLWCPHVLFSFFHHDQTW
jgi:hypothetical protein